MEVRGHPMLRRPPPMAAPPKPQNARKCSKEVVATIAGGYAEGITRSAWKAQLRSAQQVLTAEQGPREVNPMGMIRLSVHFGNKFRSKNLEVDFLAVDVPTAYNLINRSERSFINKKEYNPLEKKRRGGGLHIKLSTAFVLLLLRSPGLSIPGVGGFVPCVLTLSGRRDKLHLLKVTALIGGPLMLIHVVEVGLEIAILLKLMGQSWATSAPTFASTSSSWRCYPFFSALRASRSACIFSNAAVTLGESEAPEVTRSQDLTKSWTSESLAAGSALMKLVDGRWVIGEEPPTAWEVTPIALEEAMTGSPIDEGSIIRLPLPPLAMGWRPQPRPSDPWSVAVFGPASSHIERGRVPAGKRLSQWNPRIRRKGVGTNKVMHCTFLAWWVTRSCLSSSRRRSASAATHSAMASLVSKTVNLTLA
ncbi:hypothetical protein Cgig2_019039 [Carnegiea gigantea]|uniref:Uncharacterized protein n=1 Tax=Carnegiea gigantea TaxID=171969 RepID=A0A9Q1JJ49_9CARY|nr:hypothetical protein Cgig2_019039 [Carnegiea gigantea]